MKPKVEHTGLTVGGNLVDYPGDVSTKTADLTTAKILFNSVLSTPGAKFMGIDLKNFYLNTPLARYDTSTCGYQSTSPPRKSRKIQLASACP
mgnify:CR=1 FL=1